MPRFRLHYKTDAPLSINSLLYVPENHAEQFGMERMEPGVSLYSRKVLIKAKSDALLPAWLRFVKGKAACEIDTCAPSSPTIAHHTNDHTLYVSYRCGRL